MTQIPPAQDPAYKLAALQALATGGTRAKADLDAAKNAMDISRKYVLDAAMRNSQQLGVGQQGQDELNAIVNRPTDQSFKSLDRKSAADTAYGASLSEPMGRMFDTSWAANLAKVQAAQAKSGSGGGGSGSSKKDKAPWQDEYGTQANLTYALKKSDPGAKYGDYRQAYQTAIDKGLDEQTAARVFRNSSDFDETWSYLQDFATSNTPASKVRTWLQQNVDAGSNSAVPDKAALDQYMAQYRAQTNQPAKTSGSIGANVSKVKKK